MNKFLLVLLAAASLGSVANAYSSYDQRGSRYQVTVSQFDRAFSESYYRQETETQTYWQETNCPYRSNICLNQQFIKETDTVYVEERRVYDSNNDVSHIRLYRDSGRTIPLVFYTVDNRRTTVIHREFHSGYGYSHYSTYTSTYYTRYYNEVVIELPFETGWDKIFTGSIFVGAGAVIMADSCGKKDGEVGCAIGAISAAAGSASSLSGVHQLIEESRVQARIRANLKKDSNDS